MGARSPAGLRLPSYRHKAYCPLTLHARLESPDFRELLRHAGILALQKAYSGSAVLHFQAFVQFFPAQLVDLSSVKNAVFRFFRVHENAQIRVHIAHFNVQLLKARLQFRNRPQ